MKVKTIKTPMAMVFVTRYGTAPYATWRVSWRRHGRGWQPNIYAESSVPRSVIMRIRECVRQFGGVA